MSTLELEHLKHSSSSSNNLSVHSDGTLTLGNLQSLNVIGDLTVDTNTLHVDATNNRVGIGTTTGSESLNTTGNLRFQTTNTVRIEYLNTTGAYALGTTGGAAIGFNRPAAGDDEIFFETHNGGVSHAERMRINKDGFVTTPNQPAWHGTHNDNYATTYTGGTVHNMVTGLQNSYNNGNHFDYSTDRFTVPVTGYYLLYGWDIRETSTVSSGCAIGAWKNGTGGGNRIVSNYHESERAYSFTTVAYLAVNDWVSFGCTEGGMAQAFYGNWSYSGYGIRLIG